MVEVEISPITPSDLLHFGGRYAQQATLPAYAGSRALGRVIQLGDGVHLNIGDRVIAFDPGRAAWCERFIWPAARLFALPEADPIALSLLVANPPTALLMLVCFCDLSPGDWVIQNAANSSVGVSVIQIAKSKGLHTVNIVRRLHLAEWLKGFGADLVLVDSYDLPQRLANALGDGQVRIAFDAVAGEATRRLANCLAGGSTVVSYGLLSGKPCEVDPADTVFRDICLRGFWYTRWYSTAPATAIKALLARLAAMV